MDDFPKDWGFMYDGDQDEWIRKVNSGLLILYKKLTSYSTWSLSYVDNEDYQHYILESDDKVEIINQFKIFIRDSKIDEILS
jgi:hypothetical protein